MLNRILRILGVVLGVAAVFVLLVAAAATSGEAVLKRVLVSIDYAGENFFIEADEVKQTVFDLGYIQDSSKLNSINQSNIERIITNHAFIEDAEVYKELNGDLHIDVKVRKPLLRVFNDAGSSVYIDRFGVIMPLSDKYTARAPVANGSLSLSLHPFIGKNINELKDMVDHPETALLEDIFSIALTISQDEFWSAQFNQIYVNHLSEIELIPRVGDHRVLIGNATDLDKKLNKLWHFYEKGLSKTGWNEYEIINLKYANQVVCTKR